MCKKCGAEKPQSEYYANDRTCKECRKVAVRANRLAKLEQYTEYERNRASAPHRVAARLSYSKTERGLAAGNKAKLKHSENNPKKRRTHYAVSNAVRDKKLFKKPCEVCGESKVIAHHCDYDKPLEVMWLCPRHHTDWHKEHGEALNPF